MANDDARPSRQPLPPEIRADSPAFQDLLTRGKFAVGAVSLMLFVILVTGRQSRGQDGFGFGGLIVWAVVMSPAWAWLAVAMLTKARASFRQLNQGVEYRDWLGRTTRFDQIRVTHGVLRQTWRGADGTTARVHPSFWNMGLVDRMIKPITIQDPNRTPARAAAREPSRMERLADNHPWIETVLGMFILVGILVGFFAVVFLIVNVAARL